MYINDTHTSITDVNTILVVVDATPLHVPVAAFQEDTFQEVTNRDQNTSPNCPRSSRVHKTPSWMNDFISSMKTKPTDTFIIENYLQCDHLFENVHCFLSTSSELHEPQYFNEGVKNEHRANAMQIENQALQDNETWTIVGLPPYKCSIGCKWVYKIKYLSDGSMECYKAPLVSKDYT